MTIWTLKAISDPPGPRRREPVGYDSPVHATRLRARCGISRGHIRRTHFNGPRLAPRLPLALRMGEPCSQRSGEPTPSRSRTGRATPARVAGCRARTHRMPRQHLERIRSRSPYPKNSGPRDSFNLRNSKIRGREVHVRDRRLRALYGHRESCALPHRCGGGP